MQQSRVKQMGAAGRQFEFCPVANPSPKTLTADQLVHYNAEGFIAPLDVYGAEEITRVRRYIDSLLAGVLAANDARNAYSIASYHHACAGLWDIATDPRIIALVTDMLGEHCVCWATHLFAKLPGDHKAVPFHQDAVFWPLTPAKTVTVWLAIDDADADNAAMQFVPGSHLDGMIEHESKPLDGSRVFSRQATSMAQRPGRYMNALRAGQVSLHSDLLLHGSQRNTSTRRRIGLTLRYAAADVRLIEGHADWRQKTVYVAGGDPDGFWANRPRPDGEHPERMADVWGGFDGQARP